MPMTKLLVVALTSGIAAWGGWSLGERWGILSGFLCANVGLAIGWYYSRRFVREHLD